MSLFARPEFESNASTPAAAMDCTDQPHTTRGACRPDATGRSQPSSIPETQDVDLGEGVWPAAAAPEWDDVGDVSLTGTLPQSHDPSVEVHIAPPRRKMDSTQSTQSNDGRSYDRYFRLASPVPTSSSPGVPRPTKPPRSSSLGHGNVDDDFTGAVRFNFPSAAGTDKTGQDDSGFVDFGSITRLRHPGSQRPAQSPPNYFPETPDQPQNPFRHSRSQLLPTSQLFRGTQFSSPAKLASPTSSRPSPAGLHGNSISPNPVISSPPKSRGHRSSPSVVRTSSPDVLPGTASSRINDRANNLVSTGSTRYPVVPESSHSLPRKRSNPEPMSTYEPMRKSQERRATSEVSGRVSSGEDDDQYDLIARRRKARSKKEAGLKRLTAINVPRPRRPDEVEVPSTSQRRRPSQAEEYLAQCHGTNLAVHVSEGADAVREFPERHSQTALHHAGDEDSTQSDAEEEAAPAVGPTPSSAPELPRSSTMSANHFVRGSELEGLSNGDAIPETSPTTRRPEDGPEETPVVETPILEAKSTPHLPSSPPAFSTRSRKARAGTGSERAPSSTSTLSNLASTPELPSSNPATMTTGPTGSPTGSTILASSSPAVAQTRRREVRHRSSKLKTAPAENVRHSTRLGRRGSNSTDELSKSLSATPTFEQSLRASRLFVPRSTSRPGRSAMKLAQFQKDQSVFEGMAFAISFQGKKPGESSEQYNARIDFSATVQKRIKQAGGRILENGFDELFETLPMDTPSSSPGSTPTGAESKISLTREGRSAGFTALIADGHSRKVKYMQALALGLPCVAVRWVTACLDRNGLVDWTPYLLCAGQSAFLGDAIRSRSLAPYSASTARLPEVISQRAKLLEGSRILAVVKKALESRKMAYVFLAHVLGASLTRVYNIEEAKVEMRAAEESGCPFDWVYVDGKPDEEALFAPGPAGGRKRKKVAAGHAAERPLKKIRTLSDELVIQSLILGRLIEEGEMGE